MNIRASLQEAIAIYRQGRLEESLEFSIGLLSQKSNSWQEQQMRWQLVPEVRNLIAACLHKLGRCDEALSQMQAVVDTCPDVAEVHLTLGLYLLHAGQFERGWDEYEWRHQVEAINTSLLPGVQWQGEDLHGKTILVSFEQGFGDCIQFSRYLPRIKEQAERVVLKCQSQISSLFENQPYIDSVVNAPDESLRYDFYVNICSLAKIFAARPGNIPPPDVFQQLPDDRREYWQSHMDSPGFKIGIAWSGRPSLEDDINRSTRLDYFLRFLGIPNVQLFSLQLHDPIPDAPEALHQLGAEISNFEDTAAIMQELDLIVSVDTVVAHLGATLGVDTCIVLPFVEEWRWVHGATPHDARENELFKFGCAWYPDIKIFKQASRGDWEEVFDRVERYIVQKCR
jgi:hypothetical protein